MPALASVLWSLVYMLVATAFGFLSAKGWITADQAKQAAPELTTVLIGILLSGAVAAHVLWRKWTGGLLPNSPHPPSNIVGETTPTAQINAPANELRDFSNLPDKKNP